MMGSTLSPVTRLAVFSHLTLVTPTMTGFTLRRPSLIINPTMDTTSTNQSSTTSGIFSRLSHKRYKCDNIAVRYDLPADIIRNKRDSRYFPGHVPAGVKGMTKVNCQGSVIIWMVIIFFTKQWLQQVLSFIQNTVNPIGFEVDEIGRKDSEHHFGDDFVKSPEYILDSDDYF